ncbi:PREDICTED: uncharacterized protein LOC105585916 [Cercocebus atys]|uniref:uncharacterized protein LOC105585916 n=1 Tax=Cercocebus atys TaxID=9531 RepID=UPI0005F4FDD2|nr:PREDICTED: uncharacterized protein LOC105585916 [Cercocebus atys]
MAPELFLGQGCQCPPWMSGALEKEAVHYQTRDPPGVHNFFPLSTEVSSTFLLLKQAHSIKQKSPFLASAPASLQRKPESFNQVPQHDPLAFPSTQSTSSSGSDPETSLAQQATQHDPVASSSTQSTSSSGGDAEMSQAQQAAQYDPVASPSTQSNSKSGADPETCGSPLPQHDPVTSPSTQSTSSRGGDPETSLDQRAPQQHPVAFSSQSTSSRGGDPEMSLTQQQPSQEASVIQAGLPKALTSALPIRRL